MRDDKRQTRTKKERERESGRMYKQRVGARREIFCKRRVNLQDFAAWEVGRFWRVELVQLVVEHVETEEAHLGRNDKEVAQLRAILRVVAGNARRVVEFLLFGSATAGRHDVRSQKYQQTKNQLRRDQRPNPPNQPELRRLRDGLLHWWKHNCTRRRRERHLSQPHSLSTTGAKICFDSGGSACLFTFMFSFVLDLLTVNCFDCLFTDRLCS